MNEMKLFSSFKLVNRMLTKILFPKHSAHKANTTKYIKYLEQTPPTNKFPIRAPFLHRSNIPSDTQSHFSEGQPVTLRESMKNTE